MPKVSRLERMPEAACEYSMARTYQWLIEALGARDDPPIDIGEARRILDEDHYGLRKGKRRSSISGDPQNSARTAAARSCALSGRPGSARPRSARASPRAASSSGSASAGPRRGRDPRPSPDYIGALPGILQGIAAGSRNCVMMLDEIDKLGRSNQGDPLGAPQSSSRAGATFRDNYLGVPFDCHGSCSSPPRTCRNVPGRSGTA
jgi:ATP-dependent Lon protease